MRVPVRLAAALAVSFSAATAGGQVPFFAPGPTRSWSFSGCVDASSRYPTLPRDLTQFCESGVLTGGRNARALIDPDLSPFVYQLTLGSGGPNEVANQRFFGTRTGPGCGVAGCPFELGIQSMIEGGVSRTSDGPDPWSLSLTSSLIYMTRSSPIAAPGGERNLQAFGTFAVTEVTVTPEPGTYALLGTGLAGLGLVARRRRSA